MRDYEDFATQLRREIEEAGLGQAEPEFRRLDEKTRAGARMLRWAAAAAAVLVALAIGGYAGYSAYDSRKVITEHNRQFVDSLFARGLFEVEAVPAIRLEALATRSLFESAAAAEPSSGTDWFDGPAEGLSPY